VNRDDFLTFLLEAQEALARHGETRLARTCTRVREYDFAARGPLLSKSQLAMAAADMDHVRDSAAARQAATRSKPGQAAGVRGRRVAHPRKSAKEAAAIVGVSARLVEAARRLKTYAPELADEVREGRTTIAAALRRLGDAC
jgi:hypothetical protein